MRRKSSEGLLDTADDLAEKLDCLGDILEEIDQKYSEVSAPTTLRRTINIKQFIITVITGKRFVSIVS